MRLESIGMDKPVSFGTLPNGLRYYGRFDRVANAGGIGMKFGSMHAPGGKCGLPHFVEHLLSRSASKYSDEETNLILRRYLGGPDSDINVRIDRHSTFYGHLMLLKPSHMRKCFDLFAHMLKDRIVDVQDLEIERSRIQNEHCLRGVDIMDELLWETLHEMAYRNNPARYRVDCLPNELASISLSEVRAFIRKNCVPRNIFIVVLGPRFKVAERMACEYFQDWPDQPVPELDYDLSDGYAPLKEPVVRVISRSGISQDHVMIGFPVEEFGGKNHYGLRVLVHILEHLLYTPLQEHSRGVYRNPILLSQSKFHGLLTVNFATVHPDFVEPGIVSVSDLCRRLRESLVDPNVFNATVHRTFYEWVGPFVNDANELLELIIDSAANGDEDLMLLHAGRAELEKVTRRTIMNLANQFLTPEFLKVHIKPA